jgi:hypothetical protein
MAIEILDGALKFSIDGFMRRLQDFRTGGTRSLKLGFHVIDKYRQALGAVAELGWARLARFRLIDHDAGIAKQQLCSTRRVAVAVMLRKTKDAGEPGKPKTRVSQAMACGRS